MKDKDTTKSTFDQLFKPINNKIFSQQLADLEVDKYAKKLNTQQLIELVAHAQLKQQKSLRDISNSLNKDGYFDVIELAGGRNAAVGGKEAWYTVSLEKVLYWNPDIIILHGFGKFEPRDVLNDPQWQPIKAVKEGKVYKLTLGWTGWDPGGFVINVMANAKAFHPDKFNFNLESEANEIFKELYRNDELYTRLKKEYNLSEVI